MQMPGITAQAATRYVGACGAPNTATLTAAVSAAGNGDTILICPGTYNEAVTVNKDNLTLGASTGNRADVTLSSSAIPLSLTGQNLTIRDLTVRSSNSQAIKRPWSSTGSGAYLLENLDIGAKQQAIFLDASSAAAKTTVTLRNLVANSDNDHGIQLNSGIKATLFENVAVSAKNNAIHALEGADSLNQVNADSSHATAIYLGGLYAASLTDVTATANNGKGIHFPWAASGKSHSLSNVTVNAKEHGIHVEVSGQLTLDTVTVDSRNGDALRLEWGAGGAHVLSQLQLTAGNGHGLYAAYGLGSVTDFSINAKNYGIYTLSRYALTLERGSLVSTNSDGIRVDSYIAAAHTLRDLTISAKNHGIRIANTGNLEILRACTRDADTGIRIDSVSGSGTIRDSKFASYKDYGVDIRASQYHPVATSSSCLLKATAPRAYSSATAHAFNGNYWQGVAGGQSYSDGNVRDSATLAACPVLTCYGDAPVTSAPVAEWRMDELSWSSGVAGQVLDSVGGAHGTAFNATTTASGKLCRGGDLSASGTSDYLRLPESVLNGRTDFSLALWFKTSVNKNQQEWLQGLGSNANDDEIELYLVNTNSLRLKLMDTENAFTTASSVADGNWHHLAITRSGASGCVYVDGALSGCATYPTGNLSITASTLLIGQEQDSFGGSFASNQSIEGWVDEYKVFASALSVGQVAAGYANEAAGRNWDGTTRACAVPATGPAALNAVEVGAHPVTGQITTKTAGTGFSLDIYALNAGRTAQDSAATGDVLVDLVANSATGVALDANNCPVSGTALGVGTVTLAAGQATAAVPAVANTWRDARVRMRYPAAGPYTVTACSADNFAVKPASLAAVASHADWQSAGSTATLANTGASGGAIHKAGRPFTLRLTGYAAGGAVTSQYDGSPTASLTCVLPASGCTAGSLATGTFAASGGTVTSNTASYSEVGAISATLTDTGYASVDSDDTAASCTGYYACAAAIPIGRFVPDHFDTATNTPQFHTACGGFTYLGQPFDYATAPVLTVTAKNAAGATTVNYTGSLFKLAAAGVTGQAYTAAAGTPETVSGSLPAPTVTGLGAGVGSVAFSVGDAAAGGGLRFARGNTPLAPFDAELTLGFSLADAEGVTPISNPLAFGAATAGAGIAFDAGKALRFGRLRLTNATGSELRALPVPLTAQYWNGQGYVANTADNCTVIPPLAAVAQTSPLSPGLTFYAQTADNRLTAGETSASLTSPLVAGSAGLVLGAPGTGNHGYLDLVADTPAWLKFNWDGVDQSADGNWPDDNPRARATFGKRRGADSVIIRREIY